MEPDSPSAREGWRPFRERPLKPAAIPDDPPSIRNRFYVTQKGERRLYYADYQQKQLAITADPKKIRTRLDDRETVSAMLNLANVRGWQSIKARGSKEFVREAWVQGQVRGVEVKGYKATDTDRQEVSKRLAEMGETFRSKPPGQTVLIRKPEEAARRDNLFAKAETAGQAARATSKPVQQSEKQSAGMAA
jgi:hypothetical protein